MKRILTASIVVAALLLSTRISMAQDIIHTYDSAPVKAKVLEIGDDYMYYKTWDNQDGPLYNMSLSRVVKIVFENGTVKTFPPASPYIGLRAYEIYPLDYRWGHYYGPYGRIVPGDISDYIGYTLYGGEYMKARNQHQWGTCLTWGGIAFMSITIAAHIAYAQMDDFTGSHGMSGSGYTAGVLTGYIGSVACLGAGIPLWVKGSKGLRKIADDYNRTYVNPDKNGNAPNLSVGTTRSGVGLAFNF